MAMLPANYYLCALYTFPLCLYCAMCALLESIVSECSNREYCKNRSPIYVSISLAYHTSLLNACIFGLKLVFIELYLYRKENESYAHWV